MTRQYGWNDADEIGNSTEKFGSNYNNSTACVYKSKEKEKSNVPQLFINRIPIEWKERELQAIFSAVGRVNYARVLPSKTGDQAYGFVGYDTLEDSREAINRFHDRVISDIEPRPVLSVQFAKYPPNSSRTPRDASATNGHDYNGGGGHGDRREDPPDSPDNLALCRPSQIQPIPCVDDKKMSCITNKSETKVFYYGSAKNPLEALKNLKLNAQLSQIASSAYNRADNFNVYPAQQPINMANFAQNINNKSHVVSDPMIGNVMQQPEYMRSVAGNPMVIPNDARSLIYGQGQQVKPPTLNVNNCFFCCKPAFFNASCCNQALYCSESCLNSDWTRHRRFCPQNLPELAMANTTQPNRSGQLIDVTGAVQQYLGTQYNLNSNGFNGITNGIEHQTQKVPAIMDQQQYFAGQHHNNQINRDVVSPPVNNNSNFYASNDNKGSYDTRMRNGPISPPNIVGDNSNTFGRNNRAQGGAFAAPPRPSSPTRSSEGFGRPYQGGFGSGNNDRQSQGNGFNDRRSNNFQSRDSGDFGGNSNARRNYSSHDDRDEDNDDRGDNAFPPYPGRGGGGNHDRGSRGGRFECRESRGGFSSRGGGGAGGNSSFGGPRRNNGFDRDDSRRSNDTFGNDNNTWGSTKKSEDLDIDSGWGSSTAAPAVPRVNKNGSTAPSDGGGSWGGGGSTMNKPVDNSLSGLKGFEDLDCGWKSTSVSSPGWGETDLTETFDDFHGKGRKKPTIDSPSSGWGDETPSPKTDQVKEAAAIQKTNSAVESAWDSEETAVIKPKNTKDETPAIESAWNSEETVFTQKEAKDEIAVVESAWDSEDTVMAPTTKDEIAAVESPWDPEEPILATQAFGLSRESQEVVGSTTDNIERGILSDLIGESACIVGEANAYVKEEVDLLAESDKFQDSLAFGNRSVAESQEANLWDISEPVVSSTSADIPPQNLGWDEQESESSTSTPTNESEDPEAPNSCPEIHGHAAKKNEQMEENIKSSDGKAVHQEVISSTLKTHMEKIIQGSSYPPANVSIEANNLWGGENLLENSANQVLIPSIITSNIKKIVCEYGSDDEEGENQKGDMNHKVFPQTNMNHFSGAGDELDGVTLQTCTKQQNAFSNREESSFTQKDFQEDLLQL